jgi:hypothetical protein
VCAIAALVLQFRVFEYALLAQVRALVNRSPKVEPALKTGPDQVGAIVADLSSNLEFALITHLRFGPYLGLSAGDAAMTVGWREVCTVATCLPDDFCPTVYAFFSAIVAYLGERIEVLAVLAHAATERAVKRTFDRGLNPGDEVRNGF